MARLAALAGMAAVAAATVTLLGGSPAGAVANPGVDLLPALALQTASEAETIFFEQCAPCHGRAGEGGIGPALTASLLTADERELVIRQGRGAMQAFEATLSAEDIEAIVAFTGRLAATLTYELQCAPCHGPTGEGDIGPALVPARLSFEDARRIIAEGQGGMPAHAPTYSEDQLDAITAFVQDLALIRLGSETYVQLCASCHGAAGEGGVGPALVGNDISPGEITTVISEGAGSMPGFGASLAESELQALILFANRLVAGVAAPGPPVVDGTQLYTDLCAACHGADGEGGAGPPLAALVLGDDELSTLIAEGQGGMPGFASELSAEDIDGLVEYVQTSFGEPEETATGADLYAQLCAACHGADGEGGAGPGLAALVLSDDELSTLIAEGRGSMPGFADQLSADGAANLVEFLMATFGEQDSLTTTTLATPILSGFEMYAGHCASCHGADGSGGIGTDLRESELSLNEIISRIYGGHADGMPAFEGELTGLEVQAVARFVTTLRADSDGASPGRTLWLWPLLGGALVLAALSGLWLVRRSRGSKQEVLPRGSE
ncbi:MAG: c-type cytochrome [Acidimicrobiia bacterium]|nr:c-type cytochrome [Acidimicrobiia bacterium]